MKNQSSDIYNPFNAKGLQVPGSIIGLVGFFIAAVGTVIGLCIWFELTPDFPSETEEVIYTNFGRGFSIILLSNILGIMVLALGKIFHFFNITIQQNAAILAELQKQNSPPSS